MEEYRHGDHRVLIVHVPARMPGNAWQHKGAYLMRAGDSLVPMTDGQLRQIHNETGPDFSAEICPQAGLSDLDSAAVGFLRKLWQKKSPAQNIADRSTEQLLTDVELVTDGRVTYAALILLGTREALGKHLAQAEIVFEYRSTEEPGPAADRREFRQGFLPILDDLWNMINLRNDLQHFQQGLFVWDVPTFSERAVREAVLNAVSHRDYRTAARYSSDNSHGGSRSSARADSRQASGRKTYYGSRILVTAGLAKCSQGAASLRGRDRVSI